MPLILPGNVGSATAATGYNVANSLRFNRGSSDYLFRTLGTPTNVDKATFSTWIKFSDVTSSNDTAIFAATADGNNTTHLEKLGSQVFRLNMREGSSYIGVLTTNREFIDPSAWFHIVVAFDTTQGTASNRIKLYINGVQETSFSTATYPDQNVDLRINTSGQVFNIGSRGDTGNHPDAYYAETVFIDGQQLAADQFGEFDEDSGIWKPIDVSGLTFGNNGFYLDYEADGTSTAFVDSGPDARAITVTGGVVHSFTQAKFGGSSIEFDGTNDSLDIADSTDFDFGTGNFTFEFWVYKQTSGKMAIFETRPNGGNDQGFNLEFSAADKFEWYDASISGTLPSDPSAISLNTWTHYACVRNGTTFTMYKNGTSVGTPLTDDSSSQVSSGTPTIGESSAGANDFDGFLDEIRLSNTARYTGNFTAPSAAFTSDSDTVLLIQSKASNLISADVSGTGNHFTSSGLTLIDQTTDTCTNNFATANPLNSVGTSGLSTVTFSEGNLKALGTDDFDTFFGTIGVQNGKWYWEVEIDANAGSLSAGWTTTDHMQSIGASGDLYEKFVGFRDNIRVMNFNTQELADYANVADGDILGLELDLDSGTRTLKTYHNGTLKDTATLPDDQGDTWIPIIADGTTTDLTFIVNFGNPIVALSSANSDPNGYGSFEYSTGAGYSLCTKNLAEYG